MKSLLLTALASLFVFGLQAQTFQPPADFKLEKPEDYAKYEGDVVKCYQWLKATAPGESQREKDAANKFMITWILGSQNLSVEINPKIVTFMETSPELLSIYLGAWANYSINNDYSQDKVKCTRAAINAVIEYYQDNSDTIKKDSNIEEFIEMKKKDKEEETEFFEQYIEENA
jgi:hypothetical protein